jgi:hypothetical protein
VAAHDQHPGGLALSITALITGLDGQDSSVGPQLQEMLNEARRLGTDDDLQVLHFLSVWNLGRDPHEALRLARDCQEESLARGNKVSVAHGHEVLANALTANGDLAGARPHLLDAMRGYVETSHLGCGMHCLESIAWWAAAGGAPDQAAQLLGLSEGVRGAHQRRLHWLEAHPNRAAVALCGPASEVAPEDTDAHDTIDFALELLDSDPKGQHQ